MRKEFNFYMLENEPENQFHEVVRKAGTLEHRRKCGRALYQEERAAGLAALAKLLAQ